MSAPLTSLLQTQIHNDIPLSRHMGWELRRLDASGAQCFLPLMPNHNHLGTQFGGSLYAAGALSCYALVLGLLHSAKRITRDIVITEGQIRYLAPGTGDVTFDASVPEPEQKLRFLESLANRGRARITVLAKAWIGKTCVAEVRGVYLVRLDANKEIKR